MDEINRKYHEVANIFPLMSGDDFDALKADIAENGQREAIWLHTDGSIIDGRNRHRACIELGIAPMFRTWDCNGSLVSFVVSLNMHRRHLTSGQKAMVAAEILPMLEAEGKRRQSEAAKSTNSKKYGQTVTELMNASPLIAENIHQSERRSAELVDSRFLYFICSGDKVKIGVSVSPEDRIKQIKTSNPDAVLLDYIPIPNGIEPQIHQELSDWNVGGEWFSWCFEVQDKIDSLVAFSKNGKSDRAPFHAAREAAGVVGVSTGYIADAKRLIADAPDLAEQVKSGDMKITEARRQLAQRQKVEAPPLPTDKYRVIYADPPWKYNNSGSIETANGREIYTRVEQHYPTMTIDELCAMGPDVRAMAEPDAVLFLWTTSPLLEECFAVINAWGFKYKTSIVWNKVRHTWGHYVSVRHEMLLICTRGSCTPDSDKLPNSVVTIERSDKNSEKPEQFREMIDSMYTHGRRIELFSRTNAEGWEVWGNECN